MRVRSRPPAPPRYRAEPFTGSPRHRTCSGGRWRRDRVPRADENPRQSRRATGTTSPNHRHQRLNAIGRGIRAARRHAGRRSLTCATPPGRNTSWAGAPTSVRSRPASAATGLTASTSRPAVRRSSRAGVTPATASSTNARSRGACTRRPAQPAASDQHGTGVGDRSRVRRHGGCRRADGEDRRLRRRCQRARSSVAPLRGPFR